MSTYGGGWVPESIGFHKERSSSHGPSHLIHHFVGRLADRKSMVEPKIPSHLFPGPVMLPIFPYSILPPIIPRSTGTCAEGRIIGDPAPTPNGSNSPVVIWHYRTGPSLEQGSSSDLELFFSIVTHVTVGSQVIDRTYQCNSVKLHLGFHARPVYHDAMVMILKLAARISSTTLPNTRMNDCF